jgi:hypothetical protein
MFTQSQNPRSSSTVDVSDHPLQFTYTTDTDFLQIPEIKVINPLRTP